MQEMSGLGFQEVIMRVGEIMTRDVVAVGGDATLTEAAELMKKHGRKPG